MKECKNCGMPMVKNEDFGNNDLKSVLCKHCFLDREVKIESDDESIKDENSIMGSNNTIEDNKSKLF